MVDTLMAYVHLTYCRDTRSGNIITSTRNCALLHLLRSGDQPGRPSFRVEEILCTILYDDNMYVYNVRDNRIYVLDILCYIYVG